MSHLHDPLILVQFGSIIIYLSVPKILSFPKVDQTRALKIIGRFTIPATLLSDTARWRSHCEHVECRCLDWLLFEAALQSAVIMRHGRCCELAIRVSLQLGGRSGQSA